MIPKTISGNNALLLFFNAGGVAHFVCLSILVCNQG
jgi:hypothetical protein